MESGQYCLTKRQTVQGRARDYEYLIEQGNASDLNHCLLWGLSVESENRYRSYGHEPNILSVIQYKKFRPQFGSWCWHIGVGC